MDMTEQAAKRYQKPDVRFLILASNTLLCFNQFFACPEIKFKAWSLYEHEFGYHDARQRVVWIE